MERTYAANVRGADEIKVCGFVDTIRNKSKMAFIVLKDITGKVQVTVEKKNRHNKPLMLHVPTCLLHPCLF